MAAVWMLCRQHVDAVWMPCGCRVAAVWTLYGCRVDTMWTPCGCRVDTVWTLCGPLAAGWDGTAVDRIADGPQRGGEGDAAAGSRPRRCPRRESE